MDMKNYVLIITEKPDAAKRIAAALDLQGKAKRMLNKGVTYFSAKRDKNIVVVSAIGHLYTVAEKRGQRSNYPIFDFEWLPRYFVEKNARQTRRWIETISKLAKDAEVFVDACDYDIEGSVIGYCLLKYACENKENIAKRMKYSTLTKEELEKSYAEMLPHLDFALIEAGRTRHEVDWLYGINLSRALTTAAKKWSGKYATLSTGRVQGPTLRFLAAREETIKCFVPVPYWSIKVEIEIDGSIFVAEYEKKIIETKKEADAVVDACKGKKGTIEKIEERIFQQMPPIPFDLGSLQTEAYGIFSYMPMRTLNIAQHLYLNALISYPRTSSQKLPPTINYEAILKNLNKHSTYRKLTTELLTKKELKPNEGAKEDPAHPAIYPTGNLPEKTLESSEQNIWDLIVRRFVAVFGEPALRQSAKVYINVNGYYFHLKGIQTLREGWLRFYQPYARAKEVLLPPIRKGQTVNVRNVILEDRFTKPPSRYNPSSLLERMEKAEIGTKATRAAIIKTLYDRKYIKEERMKVTGLGFEVLEVLRKYCPTAVSLKPTRELEREMHMIQIGSEKRENVLGSIIRILKPALEELKEKEVQIGEQLSNAVKEAELEERNIGNCPICNNGKLMIIYSRKTGKRFVGCTNYFKGLCKAAFPLPQKGVIKPLKKSCRGCGWPTVNVLMKGRRPWTLCFNTNCPMKKGRGKN